jgi:hypothetical protein
LIKKLLLAAKAADLAILNGRKTIIQQDGVLCPDFVFQV